VASYSVNPDGVAWARHLIDTGQYVLQSDWGKVQPGASEQNAFLKSHSWQEYARWHLGLTDGARDETKARYAFVYGDFRRLHRMGIIACQYRAAEWRHKDIELAAHDLLQRLDARHPLPSSPRQPKRPQRQDRMFSDVYTSGRLVASCPLRRSSCYLLACRPIRLQERQRNPV
jgi:hypothetical protein